MLTLSSQVCTKIQVRTLYGMACSLLSTRLAVAEFEVETGGKETLVRALDQESNSFDMYQEITWFVLTSSSD